MTRILLFLLFFVLLAADTLGLNLSLAPGLSVKNAFLYLLLAGIAVDTALARNRTFELPAVVIPYGLAILYAIFTWVVVVLVVDYPGYSALGSLILLKGGLADHLLVFLVFFYGTLSCRDTLWLARMMIWTVVLANIVTVVDALNMPDLGLIHERDDGRIGGPIGESNQYAVFLALFLPAIAALAFIETGLKRILALGGLAFSLLAFLMTASRGGIVGITAAALLGTILLRRVISGRAIVLSLAAFFGLTLLAVLVLSAIGYGDLLYDRIVGLTASGTAYDASSGRTMIWGKALGRMLDDPLTLITGFGWDTYRQFPDFGFAPHNSYLKIFFELGMVGLLLVLLTFASVLRVARSGLEHYVPELRAMLLAFIFGLIAVLTAIFFVDIAEVWIFIWAFAGSAMRLAVLAQRRDEPQLEPLRSEHGGRSRDVSPA